MKLQYQPTLQAPCLNQWPHTVGGFGVCVWGRVLGFRTTYMTFIKGRGLKVTRPTTSLQIPSILKASTDIGRQIQSVCGPTFRGLAIWDGVLVDGRRSQITCSIAADDMCILTVQSLEQCATIVMGLACHILRVLHPV